jgi:hypothetical protein
MAQNTTFRKVCTDMGHGLSVLTVAPVTNTRLAYKLVAPLGRNSQADVCGDNDVIEGFPDQKSGRAGAANGEAVLLQHEGYFEAVASGTIHINNPLTAGAAGTLRVAVVTTDFFQYKAVTEALDGEIFTVQRW